MPCSTPYRKGEELGWFEHGSTIIMLVPAEFSLVAGLREGATVRMGQALFKECEGR